MKLILQMADENGTLWIVSKEIDPKLKQRFSKEFYEMGLLAAEDHMLSELKRQNKKEKVGIGGTI